VNTTAKLRCGIGSGLLLFVALAAAVVLYHFDPAQNGFYPRCQFYSLTGLQCPGCGGLRAVHALLHGQVAEAWRLNALLVAGLPAALTFAGWHWFERRHGPGTFRKLSLAWVWVFVAMVIVFGIVRNLPATAFSWMTS
jgi:hypothetical protein